MTAAVMGIGVDIVEVDRVRDSIERWGDRFTHRIFTTAERDYCGQRPDAFRSFAARFAAKEAISKAFGTGIGEHLSWLDMEILPRPPALAPIVELSDSAREWSIARGVGTILISLSHARDYAVAQALLLGA